MRKRKVDKPLQAGIFRPLGLSTYHGGPEEIRTLDLSDANRTLSQLSYRPKYQIYTVTRKALEAEVPRLFSVLVEISGIEPLTS